MPKGGLIGVYNGITGTISQIPDRIEGYWQVGKYVGVIAVVVVGAALLMISYSVMTGKQNVAEIVKAVK